MARFHSVAAVACAAALALVCVMGVGGVRGVAAGLPDVGKDMADIVSEKGYPIEECALALVLVVARVWGAWVLCRGAVLVLCRGLLRHKCAMHTTSAAISTRS